MPAEGNAGRTFDPCAFILVTNTDLEWHHHREQGFPCHFECFRALIGDDTLMYIMEPDYPTKGDAEVEPETEAESS